MSAPVGRVNSKHVSAPWPLPKSAACSDPTSSSTARSVVRLRLQRGEAFAPIGRAHASLSNRINRENDASRR